MRSLQLLGLGSLLCVAVACSDSAESKVTPGNGASGSPSSSGAATAAGAHNSGGGSLSLGGGLTEAEGGAGADGAMPDLPSEVNVIITADNAYGFGYGTKTQLANYFGGVENPDSDDIFACPVGQGPEQYVVPAADANAGGFLYIVGYADRSTTQGVIAKFFREGAQAVFTGAGSWEACATGEDYDPGSGGPDLATINEYIVKCNAGELDPTTSSVGWVNSTGTANGKVAFGEDNSTTRDRPMPGNEFLVACDIDSAARWMWFDWEGERTTGSPFMWPDGAGNVTKDFVIFRLGADQIPRKPPA
ncbi:MAG TPA: hypothetical protein VHP33_32150 [Polyangiaceae bacterium]|nr:hypothetical protein [Polyangiaceae bacterium]